jgi:hypothetical protein
VNWRFTPTRPPAVFADQATQGLPVLDPAATSTAWPGSRSGFLLQAPARTVTVITPGVVGQDVAQVSLAEDQHVVQALTAKRSHEPLRVRVARIVNYTRSR